MSILTPETKEHDVPDDSNTANEQTSSVDRELLAPPEDVAEDQARDSVVEVASATESAAAVASAGGSTMARRVRKARRKRRGRKAVERRRSIVGAVTHTLAALGTGAVIGASTWALGWVQFPEYHAIADSIQIAPSPGDQQRVCPGPLQQLGLSDDADAAAPVGVAEIAVASTVADYESRVLGNPEGASANGAPTSVEAPGEIDGEPTALSASQSVSVSTSASKGLSVTNCTQPMATQWVVGGATTVGHTLVLDVINPGQTEARVNFEVYGTDGVVVPGLPEVVIQPGEREITSLAGVAPNANAFAVKVTAAGSAVSAFIHETITETLTPVGAEIVGATALPSTLQTLPGVFVYGRPDAEATAFANIGTTLRILNPNSQATNSTLTAYAPDGTVAFTQELELASERVIELPFAEVPEGEYTIMLEADQPVLLAGRIAPLNGNEFAWLPSSAALVGNELVPVAEGPEPRLSIFNPTAEAQDVDVDGSTVTIEPFATYQDAVTAGETVALSGVEDLSAALHYSAAGQLASVPVRPGNADAEPITVVK